MAKEAPKKQTTQQTTALSPPVKQQLGSQNVAIPEYLQVKNRAPEGGENVEQSDVQVPRLVLCQSMTPQRMKGPTFIQGLSEGMYFNNATGKVYGERVFFVPVFFYRSRIRFKDMDEGGGILCQAQDGKHGQGDPGIECLRCSYKDFKDNEAPECTEFKNLAGIVVPERGMPLPEDALILSFKSTGLKVAKAMNTMIKGRRLDYFANIFELTSAQQKNDKGTFYVPVAQFSTTRIECAVQDKNIPPSLVSAEMHVIGRTIYQGMKELQAQGKLTINLEEDGPSPSGKREPGDEEDATEASM